MSSHIDTENTTFYHWVIWTVITTIFYDNYDAFISLFPLFIDTREELLKLFIRYREKKLVIKPPTDNSVDLNVVKILIRDWRFLDSFQVLLRKWLGSYLGVK